MACYQLRDDKSFTALCATKWDNNREKE